MKTYASLQHLYYGIKALFSLTGILSLCGSDCNADAEMVEALQILQHQIYMCYVSLSNCVSSLSQLSFLASFSFSFFIYLLLRVDKNIDAQKNWDTGILHLQEITA